MKNDLKLLGKGVYSIAEAARFAQIAPITARRWFMGRQDSKSGPVLRPHYKPVGRSLAVSFLDLVDLLVVGRFREKGVPLQTVRRVYRCLRDRLGQPHPFSHARLLTDGRSIFVEWCDEIAGRELEEALSGQQAFSELLRRYLQEIEYAPESGMACRWRIGDGVVLDPERNFGKPIVDEFGIGTRVLAAAFKANSNDKQLVADLYSVTPKAVLQAVAFEKRRVA